LAKIFAGFIAGFAIPKKQKGTSGKFWARVIRTPFLV
jgi:hypothetical protein